MPHHKIIVGHCLETLRSLPERSVDCAITSPPYLGARMYETEPQIWGGGATCAHQWQRVNSPGYRSSDTNPGELQDEGTGHREELASDICSECAAWRGELGHEPSPELYCQHMVEIMREIRRVLRDDGVVWLNVGDSHAANRAYQVRETKGVEGHVIKTGSAVPAGLKPLDLIMVPHRLAMALQADDWYVRLDCVWNKQNAKPESVNGWRYERCQVKASGGDRGKEKWRQGATGQRPESDHDGKDFKPSAKWVDCPGCQKCKPNGGYVLLKGAWRPTKSHEYVFLLSKTDEYFADRNAVATEIKEDSKRRAMRGVGADNKYADDGGLPPGVTPNTMAQSRPNLGYENMEERIASGETPLNPGGANLRSVWTMITGGGGSIAVLTDDGHEQLEHFAPYPEQLPMTCIKATTSEKGYCVKCGSPWARVITTEQIDAGSWTKESGKKLTRTKLHEVSASSVFHTGMMNKSTTVGWRPTCKCLACDTCGEDRTGRKDCDCGGKLVPHKTRNAVVLDPFGGTGSTAMAADKLGRDSIMCELNPKSALMSRLRLERSAPMFTKVEVVDCRAEPVPK